MSQANIQGVWTSGASEETSRQDNLGYKGVPASEEMARIDLGRMNKYKSIIKSAGRKKGVDPALIAGIISRESRAGNQLINGRGDYGKAFGLMQVDDSPDGGRHVVRGAWDSEEHLLQATGILVDFIGIIRNKYPRWSSEEQLKGGIAAYNMGDRSIGPDPANVDRNTTGKDYSNDVIARAQWYSGRL